MSAAEARLAALVSEVTAWLHRDELRHSRLLWRLESDRKLDPAWPYADLWYDRSGAALVDFRGHPKLGEAEPPWFQAEADDPVALELLCAIRLPPLCEVLCATPLVPLLSHLGRLEPLGALDVLACQPGELGEPALSYEVTKLTGHHRPLVTAAGWRPDDFSAETDEDRAGVRWAILYDDQIVCRLLAERVSRNYVELTDLYTIPKFRRRGFGAALVHNVTRRLHERGLGVTYSVHPTNEPSRQLAVGVGFRDALSWERVRLHRGEPELAG